jgi:hypothetical protein
MTMQRNHRSNSSTSSATSETLMNTFLHSSAHAGNSAREAWLARQAMVSIMRLVKSEQLLAIRRSVKQLVPDKLLAKHVKGGRSGRTPGGHSGQTQFVFGSDD